MLKSSSDALRGLGFIRPGVLIDADRTRANIRRMADRAAASGVLFRPHFKTHQSGSVGQWFRDLGVTRITVSSLDMAAYFADFDWTDITLAVVVNPLELPSLAELAQRLKEKGGRLGLTVDSVATAAALRAVDDLPVTVWLKVDGGYGRTGLRWDDTAGLQTVTDALGPALRPAGLLAHSGHSYGARGPARLQEIWSESVHRLQAARNALGPEIKLSLGDTPCCSTVADFTGVDEVRPGNFVFYDLMQLDIGACAADDLAAAAVCPVLGVYPERGQMVLHGGAVHLAKESLTLPDGRPCYGKLGTEADGPDRVIHAAPLVSLSQEHGTVQIDDPDDFQRICGDLIPGDLVRVWPVHSCLTCDLHRDYRTGDGQVLPRR